jgi:hypothetical protein
MEVLAACIGALLILIGPTIGGSIADVLRFPSNIGEEVSPAWSAYIADRIAAGDIGCADQYYIRIGKVESVWMNYPFEFGVSPSGGVPDRKTAEALHKAHMACIRHRDSTLFGPEK